MAHLRFRFALTEKAQGLPSRPCIRRYALIGVAVMSNHRLIPFPVNPSSGH